MTVGYLKGEARYNEHLSWQGKNVSINWLETFLLEV